MLIRGAELDFGVRIADVHVVGGRIAAVAPRIDARDVLDAEPVVEAAGAALLPTLHDTHIHLFAAAAARASVHCGPPAVTTARALGDALRAADTRLSGDEWLRGIGFHESVMSGSSCALTRDWLDAVLPQRAVRIQHRSGRLWVFSSAALSKLGVADTAASTAGNDPCERVQGRASGRLYDADLWLRARLPSTRPSLATVSRELWAQGVTMLTDASVSNIRADFDAFGAAQMRGDLLQDLQVMGSADLDTVADTVNAGRRLWRGPRKFHLHEHDLPGFEALCGQIRVAHRAGRATAFHCVTRAELVFALAALRAAGVQGGDRIEHASLTPPEALVEMVALGVGVSTQPGFLSVRGDDYLREVAADDQPWLYRARSFAEAGIALALSSDAPFGPANPWQVMAAAVERRAPAGIVLGADEALTPEQALACFLHRDGALTCQPVRVVPGAPAALMLLPAPWRDLRMNLAQCTPTRVWAAGTP